MGTRRVVVVSPCFNRMADAEALVDDLLQLDQRQLDLRMVLVDNNSDKPLSQMRVGLSNPSESPAKPWFKLEHLRQNFNAGGSGGYNAGLRRALEFALPPSKTDSLGRPGEGWEADYVWMVDSDVRLAPDTLIHLLNEMERDPAVVAAGSTLADPLTGQGFELGGHINRKTGIWEPAVFGSVGVREVFRADYLAACCALVRAEAIRMTGVMPDTFLHGDDVEWFRRMQDMTGGKIVCVPWAVAMHPQFSRFSTWTRYYTGRSAFGTLAAVDRGPWVRIKRAHIEVRRAVQQALNDRLDLARLHVRALFDAARGITTGKAEDGVINVLPAKPLKMLASELDAALTNAGFSTPEQRSRLRVRLLPALLLTYKEEAGIIQALESLGIRQHDRRLRYRRSFVGELWDYSLRALGLARRPDIAIAPARGQAFCWLSAPIVVQVWTGNFVLRTPARLPTVIGAFKVGVASTWACIRGGLRTPNPPLMYPGRLARPGARLVESEAESREATAGGTEVEASATPVRLPSVTAVIVAHSRPETLRRTLAVLLESPLFGSSAGLAHSGAAARNRVVIVDNGMGAGAGELGAQLASDGHADRVSIVTMEHNAGVEAFNRGVREAAGQQDAPSDCVLILDDDAWVEPAHLVEALELLARRPELAGVAFHPRHPDTGLSEWPFARVLNFKPTDRWPVMGCANLLRTRIWEALGGYEPAFFLYRNDTDLALRILDSRGPGKAAHKPGEGPERRGTHGVGGGLLHFNPRWVTWHDTPAAGTPRTTKGVTWHRLATRNWVWMCRRNAPLPLALKASLMGWAWSHRLAGASLSRQWATLRGGLAGVFSAAPRVTTQSATGSGGQAGTQSGRDAERSPHRGGALRALLDFRRRHRELLRCVRRTK